MKKLFAVLLAVMMMASLLSFASADDYTIRIYSNSNSTERTTRMIKLMTTLSSPAILLLYRRPTKTKTVISSSDLTKSAGHSW